MIVARREPGSIQRAAGALKGHTKSTKEAKLTKGAPRRAIHSPGGAQGLAAREARLRALRASFVLFV